MKRSGRGTYPTAIADRPAAHAAAMPHALRQRRRRCCPLGETSQRAEHQKMREVKVGLECIHAPRSTAQKPQASPTLRFSSNNALPPCPQPPLQRRMGHESIEGAGAVFPSAIHVRVLGPLELVVRDARNVHVWSSANAARVRDRPYFWHELSVFMRSASEIGDLLLQVRDSSVEEALVQSTEDLLCGGQCEE